MGRNHLAHATGDAINAVLAAAGYNFCLLIKWLKLSWLTILSALIPRAQTSGSMKIEKFTDDALAHPLQPCRLPLAVKSGLLLPLLNRVTGIGLRHLPRVYDALETSDARA